MIEIVKKFEDYAFSIKHYMDNSDYKTKFFIKKLELSEPTFYRKLKNKTFTIPEIVTLSQFLFPEEYFKYKLQREIQKSRQEVKEGKISNAKQFLKETRNSL